MAYQKRKYKLTNLDTGFVLELNGQGSNNEPDGCLNAEKTWKRSTKNFSFTTELSKDYKFTGAGATFLRNAYNGKDIEASVEMIEYRFNPNTDEPYIYSIGTFDFSQYSSEKTTVSIPFKSGGLKSLIKSKLSTKFELDRLDSINGQPINELITNEFAVVNRPIDLNSKSEVLEDENSSSYLIKNTENYDTNISMLAYPFSLIYKSDDSFVSQVANQASKGGGDQFSNFTITGNNSSLFYVNSKKNKNVNILLENITFDFLYQRPQVFDPLFEVFRFGVMRFSGGEDPLNSRLNPELFTEILDLTPDLINYETYSFSIPNQSISINLKKGDSLTIGVFTEVTGLSEDNVLSSIITNATGLINLNEKSNSNELDRRAKCVLNKNIGSKLMSVITGDGDKYRSDFFTNSQFKLTGGSTGKWIRGFDTSKFTTSLKEFTDNSNALFNMAYDIQFKDGKEVLVHEPLDYFFKPESVIVLPNQVSNVKRTVAKELVFSFIKAGYKKPSGDNLYEEVNGLGEFNTTNEYDTPITRLTKEYNIESPYRADSAGKELTLRQSIKVNPTGDYRTDKHVFNLDLKESVTEVFEERTWIDDFSQAPKSEDEENPVFSPDTLTGLRLTPYRNMSRHFWFLNNAYTKETNKSIRYASTRSNSDLITKEIGKEEVAENGSYLINDLTPPLFVSQWVEFEHEVSFDILNQVNGYTNKNGIDIPNLYFRIEFTNEFNEKEYGYLFELKPSKSGKWKVLKAI